MPVLLHPRSEQYYLSEGHLGTSQDFPLRQYFSYIPGPSSTICPWDSRISHYASPLHPRSEQYHLSLGYLGTSHYTSTSRTSQVRAVPFVLGISWDIPLRQYFSYIPGLSSTSCRWDFPGFPTMLVLLVHPRSEQYHLSLGHPRTSHYTSTSRTSQVRAVPFVLGTSWDIPRRPTTPVLLIHPRSEQYYLSLRHLGISQYFQLWQHFSCMYVCILLGGTIGGISQDFSYIYVQVLSIRAPWYPK